MYSETPRVCLNAASSLDGKITTFQREKVRFSSDEDRELLEDLRSRADAVLIGAGTLLVDDPPLILRIPKYQAQRKKLNKPTENPINAVVSARLDFPVEDSDFFNHPATERIVFTTDRAPRDKRERLSRFAQVIELPACDKGRVDLKAMMQAMRGLKINHLVLEGGGSLNFDMLRQKLVDEIYVTVCPFVIGGKSSPTIFDGGGFTKASVRRLELLSHRVGSNGEIFLRYKVLDSEVSVEASNIFHKGYVIS